MLKPYVLRFVYTNEQAARWPFPLRSAFATSGSGLANCFATLRMDS